MKIWLGVIQAASGLLADPALGPDGRSLAAQVASHPEDDATRRQLLGVLRGEQPLWDFPENSLAGREVAAYLNVKEATIRHWVHIGYIPHIKFRGSVRYRQETIDTWLEKCAVGMRHTPKRIAQDILDRMNRPASTLEQRGPKS